VFLADVQDHRDGGQDEGDQFEGRGGQAGEDERFVHAL
jgi:hypothetical protein